MATDQFTLDLRVPQLGPRALWANSVATAGSVQLGGTDFNRERNSYCRQQVDRAEFVDQHLGALTQYLARYGWALGPILADQYRRFAAATEGPLRFIASPPDPIPLTQLFPVRELGQWLSRVNFSSQLGGSGSTPLDIVAITPVLPNAGPQVYVPEKSPAVVRRENRWIEVSPGDLPRHVGRPIRVNTSSLNQYSGYLESVAGGQVVVATRISGGGVAQIPIPVNQLQRVEVIPRRSQ